MINRLTISLAGQSNVGKSSLINLLCKNYVTSESKKLQTTRINTYHNASYKGCDFLLIDTPGISVVKKDLMSEFMKKSYIKSLSQANIIFLLSSIENSKYDYEKSILKISIENNIKIFLIANKIDKINNNDELQLKVKLLEEKLKNNIYPISVKNDKGIDNLMNDVLAIYKNFNLTSDIDPSGLQYKKNIIQELIRGVINNDSHGEIPYESAVFIENINITKKLIKIRSNIIVNNINQKKIIIGKDGKNIKNIGIESRKLIEKNYSKAVYLELHVLVNENWRNNIKILEKMGFKS